MKQQERSQETRSHILAAAEQSFAERGYDITSVDSICRAAGVRSEERRVGKEC